MTRTTPPRPADIAAAFPELIPLARTATRLHPRPGSPSPRDSSVGGPLLWPAHEPWPHCDGPHWASDLLPARSPADVRQLRRLEEAARAGLPHTLQEQAEMARIKAGHPTPTGPIAMLALAQLYVHDVPVLRRPGEADLLQVLWCPFDHGEQNMPRTELLWRSSTEVTDVLTPTPEPDAVQYGDYLPEPCPVDSEQIVEYPAAAELDEELRRRVAEWSTRQTAGAGPGGLYDGAQELFYDHELSLAPGWKAGGWAPWSVTDPHPRYCTVCRSRMEPMLTVASYEWQPDGPSWVPYEDRAAAASPTVYPTLANPTRINLAGGYNQQIYSCPASPEHPHATLLQ
ncbi:hypothetical protein ABZT02_41640 [Streptomyces sp. NPDC005402]|uniref:hypothetical protein n=1 Tax=Streptomyces sp. NPDC005402 TaxID=3155338 RepID=UPI0033A87E6D